METQSSDRQAGTTPSVLSRPGVGFRPTILLQPAGTRPDPAVSVPSANDTSPAATATADPEPLPPDTNEESNTLRQAPRGERRARGVGSWWGLVLASGKAAASCSRATTGAVRSAR